jgi:hypothetical protein
MVPPYDEFVNRKGDASFTECVICSSSRKLPTPYPFSMSLDSFLTQRLSVSQLSQKILEMASTGVYRESVFEALQPFATKKQIREAIAHAKRFGLCSVASLRDSELGTYYQLDAGKYNALQHALHSPTHLGKDAELVQRLTAATQTAQQMATLAKGLGIVLILPGVLAWGAGLHQLGVGFLGAAMSAFTIWWLQRQFVQRLDRSQ